MNKRGMSEAYFLVIQLIVIGLVITALIYKANNTVDPAYIRMIATSQNLGLVISTLSFMPGNANFTYLTEDNANMFRWSPFYSTIFQDNVKFSKKSGEKKESYESFANNLIKYNIPETEFKIEGKSLEIQKTNSLELTNNIKNQMRQLPCTKLVNPYKVRPLNGGRENAFYTKNGKLVTEQVTEKYVGFDKQYFSNGERVYAGSVGLVSSTIVEKDEMLKIAKVTNPDLEDNFIAKENLKEKQILLTVGDYNSTKSFIFFYIPFDTYDVDYNISCTILNKILAIDSPSLQSSITDVLIMPSNEKSLILELGNINLPHLFVLENNQKLIGEALKNG